MKRLGGLDIPLLRAHGGRGRRSLGWRRRRLGKEVPAVHRIERHRRAGMDRQARRGGGRGVIDGKTHTSIGCETFRGIYGTNYKRSANERRIYRLSDRSRSKPFPGVAIERQHFFERDVRRYGKLSLSLALQHFLHEVTPDG